MTEPNDQRRRQPQQARTDVATTGGPGGELSPQARRMAERKEMITRTAQMVQSSAPLFERLLPEHISTPTFMGAAGAALYRDEKLMEGAASDPDAFMNALREAASLGHIPGTDHYWLTPRKSFGKPSVLGIEGYQGIIERMYRSGGVLSVHAEVVRANDVFEPYAGPGGRPVHKIAGKRGAFSLESERGDIIGVYAYAMLPGGVSSQQVLLNMEHLAKLRAMAAAGGKVWDQWDEAMFRKSALRRLEAYVPVSAGYRSTAVQATSVAVVQASVPPALTERMEDQPVPQDDPAAIEAGPDGGGGGDREDRKPVTDVPYDPKQWGADDPAWESLPVARPGQGVPPEVRNDK